MADEDTDRLGRQSEETSGEGIVRIDRVGKNEPSTIPVMHANQARELYRRELELQLQKIRSQASAARLDAEAAEIELMIRRLQSESLPLPPLGEADSPERDFCEGETPADSLTVNRSPLELATTLETSPKVFHHWDDVRRAMNLRIDQPHDPLAPVASDPTNWTRIDSPHITPRHHFEDDPAPETSLDSTGDGSGAESGNDGVLAIGASQDELPHRLAFDPTLPDEGLATSMQAAVTLDAELQMDDEQTPRRTRPGAWLISAFAHVAILVLLAGIGLTQHQPKDQVALTAASASAEQVSMQTFEIETSEPQHEPQPNEPTTSDVQYDLSPVGEVSAAEMISEAPSATASSSVSAMLSRPAAAATSMSMKPNADATMEFCGVKGGGNHFVYLVDSSGSMGDAFDSARAELLRSIDLLKPEQRFYVIFFDAQPDYMRLTDPNVDETRSVNATRVNRDALKRWAMRINKDRGMAPYDALRFALKLKPDVIFLLSDGEFPQGIEDLLREENRIVNLFGDDDPICIVHTIGYHSKEGESRMKRIAEQNQGMYRHVPKP